MPTPSPCAQALEAEGRLLPLEASFFPGVTPIPNTSTAWA
jgi:hypothetical protein